jgi:hypothetical protein
VTSLSPYLVNFPSRAPPPPKHQSGTPNTRHGVSRANSPYGSSSYVSSHSPPPFLRINRPPRPGSAEARRRGQLPPPTRSRRRPRGSPLPPHQQSQHLPVGTPTLFPPLIRRLTKQAQIRHHLRRHRTDRPIPPRRRQARAQRGDDPRRRLGPALPLPRAALLLRRPQSKLRVVRPPVRVPPAPRVRAVHPSRVRARELQMVPRGPHPRPRARGRHRRESAARLA